jgi:hypothetical protein
LNKYKLQFCPKVGFDQNFNEPIQLFSSPILLNFYRWKNKINTKDFLIIL